MRERILHLLLLACTVSAQPLIDKRQFPSVNGVRGAASPAQILAFQQQQQALAKINAQQVSENVYRVQPTDQAATYSSALIILMPKEGQAGTLGDLMKLTPVVSGIMSPAKGQPAANAAPSPAGVPAAAPAGTTPTQNQAPLPATIVAPANQAPVVAAPAGPTATGTTPQTTTTQSLPVSGPAVVPVTNPATLSQSPVQVQNPIPNAVQSPVPVAAQTNTATAPLTPGNNTVTLGKAPSSVPTQGPGSTDPGTKAGGAGVASVASNTAPSIAPSPDTTTASLPGTSPANGQPGDATPAVAPEASPKAVVGGLEVVPMKMLQKVDTSADTDLSDRSKAAEKKKLDVVEQTSFGAARGSGPISKGLTSQGLTNAAAGQ